MALPTGVVASGSESLNDALVWFDAADITDDDMPYTLQNKGKAGAALALRTGSTDYTQRAHVKDGALNLPGRDGNYATVPDANYLDITGDIEIVFKMTPSGTPATARGCVVKNNAYRVITGNADASLLWWAYWNGSSWSGINSNAGIVLADTARWYKVTRVQSTGVMSVFWAPDQETEPTSWNAAGSGTVNAGTPMPTSTFQVELGSRDTGLGVLTGKIHRALIRNGISGTSVVDVDFSNKGNWVQFVKDSTTNNAVVSIVSSANTADPKFLPFYGRKYLYTTGATGSGAWLNSSHPTVTEVDIRVNVTNVTATSDDLMTVGYRGGVCALLLTNTTLSLQVRSTDVTTPSRYPAGVSYDSRSNMFSWLAGTFNPTTRAWAFYGYSQNVASPPDDLSSWTLIGSGTASAGSAAGQWNGSLDSSGASFQWIDIMANNQGGGGNIEGRFYGFQLRSSINGPLVDSMTCSNAVSSSRTFLSDGQRGGTVTVTSPPTGAKTVIVTRPIVLFRTDDFLEIPADPYGAYATLPGTANNYFSAPDSAQLDIEGQQGTKFLHLPGDASYSFATIPNAANVQIVGDLELVARVALDNYAQTSSQILISKGYAGEFYFTVGTTAVGFHTMIGGTLRGTSVAWSSRPANGTAIWLKVTKVASTGAVAWYSAADQTAEPSSWTLIGTGTLPVAGNSDSSTNLLGFGAGVQTSGYVGGERMKGKFYRGIVRSTIGGAAVVDVDFTAQTIGATTFTATTGQTVTLGGTTNPTRIVDGTTFYAVGGFSASTASTPSTTSLNISGSQATGFLSLPGIATNWATIPHSASFNITGDMECVARLACDDWTPAANMGIMERDNADGNRHFYFQVTSTGGLRFRWFTSGTAATSVIADSTIALPATNGTTYWVKATIDVDNGAGGYDVKFWYAADQSAEPSSWTQLGTTVTGAGVTNLWASTSTFIVAGGNASGAFAGKIYRTILRNGIGGTTVMDANFTLPALGATSFTATAGGTVTVNGTNAKIVDGATYLYAPGLSGSIATAPNSAALQLVGDRTFTADVALAKWNPTSGDQYRYFISKRVGGTGEYFFRTDPNTTPRGCLQLVWYEGGVSKSATSTTNPVAADGTRLQVAVTHDVDNGAGGNDVRFFTRANDNAAWVQLGSTVTNAGIAAPTATTAGVAFGAEGPGGLQETAFKYYRVTAANGIGAGGVPGGTIVLDARFDRQLQFASSFVEASSNAATVSMSGGAVIQRNRDIEIVTRVMLDDWTPATRQTLVAKYNEGTAQRSYALTVNDSAGGGVLLFQWSTNGAAAGGAEVGSSAPSLVDGTTYWLKATLDVDNGSGGSTVTFYKANDQATEPTSWTTISTHTIAGGTAFFPGTSTLTVGATADNLRPVTGKIYRAIVRNKAIPSTVFDADFSRQIQFATSFLEGSANSATVTMNGNGGRIERQRDLEIVARVRLDDWSPASTQTILGKWTTTGNQRSYQLAQLGTTLTLMVSSDGGNNGATEQTGVNFGAAVDGTTYWVKVTKNSMTGLVSFFYAADQAAEPTSWTSLGTNTMSYRSGAFPGTGVVEVGSVAVGSTFNLAGRVYRVILRNGINGTRLLDWNAHGFSIGSTTHRDEQGNLWTANGSVSLVNLNPLNIKATDSLTIFVAGRVWTTIDGPYIGKGSDFFSATFVGWCSYLTNRTRVGDGALLATNTNGSGATSGAYLNSMHVVDPSNISHFLNGVANGATTSRSSVGELANPYSFVVGKRGAGAVYSDFELLAFGVWKRALNANEAATLVARYS